MDFSSVPVYLDPPNWHQQSNHHHHHHQQISNESHHHQLLSLPTQLPPVPPSHVGGSSIRRGSMADRARLANVPLPETALKCPRCESTNTKFCYFNNYSLSQPRHFCKACRRYWTRGGALRNVPVGGGCRRNKKNKGRRSKSPAAGETQLTNSDSPSSTIPLHSTTDSFISHSQPQLSFMASLQNFTRFGGGNLGLHFNEIQPQAGEIGSSSLLAASGVNDHHHQWRNPLSGSLETPQGLYPFQINEANPRVTQLPPVKIEETQVLNLLKPSNLEVNSENNQFWSSGNGWTDISALSSSSSGQLSCDFTH